jgi:carbon monoxide dehydrogenase subunit G
MAKLDKTIVIAAPVSDVFDYVSQPEHFPNFLPVTDLTFITDMHRGVGTRLRYSFALGRKRIPTECNLSNLEVDRSVTFHTTTGVACDWNFTFREAEAGTQLRWEGEHEIPVGFLDRLLGRSAGVERVMEATIEDSLQKLKETLESR